jgi:hypothetical protein
MSHTAAAPLQPSRAVRAILWSLLIAGPLDMSDALIFTYLRGGRPFRVLLAIASAALGPTALKGGWGTAMVGLSFHFLIVGVAATVYWVASRWLPFLTRYAVVSGLVYGGIVYLFMNRVVIPLSLLPKPTAPPSTVSLVNGVLAVMLFVGLPIALIVRRYSR